MITRKPKLYLSKAGPGKWPCDVSLLEYPVAYVLV